MKRRCGPVPSEAPGPTIDLGGVAIPTLANMVLSTDPLAQYNATVQIRKLLSIANEPPIDQVVASGVVPRLVAFLDSENRNLQFEAAWALTNIASGTSEQTQLLVRFGAVDPFIRLLSNQDEDLREQAVWALGNVAGDSTTARDFIIAKGILEPLLVILQFPSNKVSMQRTATWTLSNLCRGKPAPPFHNVAPSLPVLARLLYYPDQEVLVDAVWAISYLSDGSDENIQAVLNSGVLPRTVELLGHDAFAVKSPAVRAVGNILTGNELQTQAALDLGILPIFLKLLHSPKKTLRKEVCWGLSNVTASNPQQTQAVIDAQIFPKLIAMLDKEEIEVKRETAWALSNATSWKQPAQVGYLVSIGSVRPLVELLTSKDSRIIIVALDCLNNILATGAVIVKKSPGTVNPFVRVIEEAEGLDRLEDLQDHQNEDIYKKSLKILEDYFVTEEEAENLKPNVSTGNTYTFGVPQTFSMPPGGFAF